MGKSGFNMFVNAYEVTPSTTGAWEDVDVSSFVPSGSSGAIVELSETSNSLKQIFVRAKGSTQDFTTYTNVGIGGHVYNVVKLDSNGKFQAYREAATGEIWLLGYTDASVVLTTDWTKIADGTGTGLWSDVNAGPYVSYDATGVICQFLIDNTAGAYQREARIRKKGSTDDEADKNFSKGPADCLCGLNASKIFQQKCQTHVEIWIKGYTTPPVQWFTNVVKKGPVTSEATWEEISCSGDVGTGVGALILELVNFNVSAQSTRVQIRKRGSTDNRVDYDDRIVYQGHAWAFVGLDSAGYFEGWVKRDIDMSQEISKIKFYIQGYCSWTGNLKTKLETVSTDIETHTSSNPLKRYLGSTIRFKLTLTDDADTAIDPTSVTLTMYDPAGTATSLSGTEIKESTGIYYVDYTTSSSGHPGKWKLVCTITKAGKTKTDLNEVIMTKAN